MKRYGQVHPGTSEWTLKRHPDERMSVSRASIEVLQAEIALMHEVLVSARLVAGTEVWAGENIARLRIALARYDGWLDDPDVRDDLVGRLLRIEEDLDHG